MRSKFFLLDNAKNKILNKKILFTFIFCLFIIFQISFSNFIYYTYALPDNIKITTNSTPIFEEANTESEIIASAYYGDIFEVISADNQFYFVKISDSLNGYVLMAYSNDATLKDIPLFLDTNGYITKQTKVFDFVENEYIETIFSLEKNTKIKIVDGLNTEKKYTKISFEQNNNILTYYVPTNTIEADGISKRTIIAIMLIVSSATLFWIFYSFFKGKTN